MILIRIYATMLPLIFGGISNMIFTKTDLYNKYKYPIDNGKKLADGKRVLGDNKTYIGFVSMIFFVLIYQLLWGILCNICAVDTINDWYNIHENNLVNNVIIGLNTGFIYMICELPNSFIKRRIDIPDGKTATGIKGIAFFILDQIDSLVGVFLFLVLYSQLGIVKYFQYLLVGGGTHIVINIVLHSLKIRKNI